MNETLITLDLWARDGFGTARQQLTADVASEDGGERCRGQKCALS